jgi:sensor histidine kinase regulating citrate/malate metabolism
MTELTINNVRSLITRTINQATSLHLMLRELFQNALEATSKQISGKKQIKIRNTDPAWFGLQRYYSKHKFGIFNTGPGMDAYNLRKATDLSSSIGKTQGVHNNFGEGAKVSALPVNKSGMIWVSCHNKEVNMVVLRLAINPNTHEAQYERQDFPDGNGGTTDV